MAEQSAPLPQRPSNMPPYAEECLLALAAHNLGDKILLGGAFGLAHYFEYRTTQDVDAWWVEPATTEDQQQVVAVIAETLKQHGEVRRRAPRFS